MANYRVGFTDGSSEFVEADSFDLKEIPGWVTFHRGGQLVDTISAGSMKRPPQVVPPEEMPAEKHAAVVANLAGKKRATMPLAVPRR